MKKEEIIGIKLYSEHLTLFPLYHCILIPNSVWHFNRSAILKVHWRLFSAEDLKTSSCLSKAGGRMVDTRDEFGRETFLPPFSISQIRSKRLPSWYIGNYRKPIGFCDVRYLLFISNHHYHLSVHFLPRFIKGIDGCFPTAYGRQLTSIAALPCWVSF